MERSQLFVCFDLHGPAWKPATANQTISENTYLVWFNTEPSWAYPASRSPLDKGTRLAGYHRHKPSRVLPILTITGFTNVLRVPLMDWKQLLKMDAPCIHVQTVVYLVRCERKHFECFSWRSKTVYGNTIENLFKSFLLGHATTAKIYLRSHATYYHNRIIGKSVW